MVVKYSSFGGHVKKLINLDIVVRATNDLEIFGSLTYPTLCTIDGYGGYDKTILYAVLHEAIYCQGYEKKNLEDCHRISLIIEIENHLVGLQTDNGPLIHASNWIQSHLRSFLLARW